MITTSLRAAALLAGAAALSPSAAAQASADDASARPSYTFLRQDEDWSAFEGGDDFFDPIKHVDLSSDGSVWVSFGGRVESRVEIWDDFAFGGGPPATPNNDVFWLSRALLHGDFHFGENLRLFAEGKTAQSTDRDLPGGRRDLDLDTLDLQQLFVDLRVDLGEETKLVLRPGRQMVSFGKQRLVSPLPWGNTLRTWDGVTAVMSSGAWSITGLVLAFAPVDRTNFNETDEDELLYGLYGRWNEPGKPYGAELYSLGNTREDFLVNGTFGDARRQTLGLRAWGPIEGGFDWEVEGAWQTGRHGANDVHAGFATAELGWRPAGVPWDPRFAVGADWASGDERPGGDVGTFDQIYPLGHAYFGFMDFVGRQNVVATRLDSTWKPFAPTTLRGSLHSFWLADQSDALYNAGGGVLRAPGGFDSSHVGLELDLYATQKIGRHLEGFGGYSHFFTGSALASSGPDRDSDFVYLGLRFTF